MNVDRINRALSKLSELGANELKHVDGTLGQHLKGTHQLLMNWGNSDEICMAGLSHAMYGTDGFPELLVRLERRAEIAEVIGAKAEELVYFYCSCDRRYFYPNLVSGKSGLFRDRFAGAEYEPDEKLVKSFCEVTIANELEIAARDEAHREKYRSIFVWLFSGIEKQVSAGAFKMFQEVFELPITRRSTGMPLRGYRELGVRGS